MTAGISIAIDDLHFTYPGEDRPVLAGLKMHVSAGERVAVLGPNGSGKTTFVLHINGLLRARRGTITIGDLVVDDANLAEIRRRVGIVFQDPNDQLFMHSVADDVAFGPANLALDKTERQRRVDDSLASVGASDLADRTPHHLSGGEKRRAALATALAMKPDVLVFDEPTSGLDPMGRHELAELVASLPQTQLIVTHDLPFVEATCERAIILDGGRVAADLETDALLADNDLLASHRLAPPNAYSGGSGQRPDGQRR